jgi:hypothetical protein
LPMPPLPGIFRSSLIGCLFLSKFKNEPMALLLSRKLARIWLYRWAPKPVRLAPASPYVYDLTCHRMGTI